MVAAYFDVGLALYAALLAYLPAATKAALYRAIAKHSLLKVYTAVLVAASLWPVLPVAWFLRMLGGGHDE
jgi:hypothetical protein